MGEFDSPWKGTSVGVKPSSARHLDLIQVAYGAYIEDCRVKRIKPEKTPNWCVDLSQQVDRRPWGEEPRCFNKSSAVFCYSTGRMLTYQDNSHKSKHFSNSCYVMLPTFRMAAVCFNRLHGGSDFVASKDKFRLMGWPDNLDLSVVPKAEKSTMIGESIHLGPLGVIIASIVAASSHLFLKGAKAASIKSAIEVASSPPKRANRRRLGLSCSNPWMP
jgi:hypothetical protein